MYQLVSKTVFMNGAVKPYSAETCFSNQRVLDQEIIEPQGVGPIDIIIEPVGVGSIEDRIRGC